MENEYIVPVMPAVQSDIEVYWQDEVTLDLDVYLIYIKSGQNEVKKYTEEVIKPDIQEYTKSYIKPILEEAVNREVQPAVDSYVDEVIKPDIENFASGQMSEYATRSETAADRAEEASQNAQSSESASGLSAQKAQSEAGAAENSQQAAAVLRAECEQLKSDCQSIKAALSGVYKWCGSVTTAADLPSNNVDIGDVYNVLTTDMNYAWTGSSWDQLGSSIYNIGYGLTLSDNTVSVNQGIVAMLSKFQVVSALPSVCDGNTFYFVRES